MGRKTTIYIEGMTCNEAARVLGTYPERVRGAYYQGCETLDAIRRHWANKKAHGTRPPSMFADGEPLSQIRAESGVPYATIRWRWNQGARTVKELTCAAFKFSTPARAITDERGRIIDGTSELSEAEQAALLGLPPRISINDL